MFVIIVEGLQGLMHNVSRVQSLRGFKVSEQLSYNLMRFADDAQLLVGEANWENLWEIIAILRGLEMVLGLSINMLKSELYKVGVKDQFMHMTTIFLRCRQDVIPFKCLGISIGWNPRRIDALNQ